LGGGCRPQTETPMLFVFEVHLKPGHTAEQYADAWVRASTIIQQSPGARGTRLHRRIDNPRILLAIASWESKEIRDAMEASQTEAVRKIIAEQAPFVDIQVVGEFEDAEWIVSPTDHEPEKQGRTNTTP
jgi:heme-degrading monooxygenase HmoA